MNVLNSIKNSNHEMVSFYQDKNSGLNGIIAIHDTTLGPALGGLRIWPYASESEALQDVLNLSKAMTYKASLAGLHIGGGKGVIIADPNIDKTESLLRSWGRFVNKLGGTYATTTDVGTNSEDMELIATETDFVVGMYETLGGSGDSSLATARGVFKGMYACILHQYNTENFKDLKIAIEGFGKVGSNLANQCRQAGMKVIVSEINPERIDLAIRHGYDVYTQDDLLKTGIDIFSPCALGGTLNADMIRKLDNSNVKIVAGCANNQLVDNKAGYLLHDLDICYAPDYLINAGGLINASCELEPQGYVADRGNMLVDRIFDRMQSIIKDSISTGLPTFIIADKKAEQRIKEVGNVRM